MPEFLRRRVVGTGLAVLLFGCGNTDDGPDFPGILTIRASLGFQGKEGNGTSGEPSGGASAISISKDGRYVVFGSDSTNLIANDTNNARDVFLRDTISNSTVLVSASTTGAPGNDGSDNPSLSSDGRYVAFESKATNLVTSPAVSAGVKQVYRWDRETGAMILISQALNSGTPTSGNDESKNPTISNDGDLVAFETKADNLDGTTGGAGPGDPDHSADGRFDIYVRAVVAATTTLLSRVTSGGAKGDGDSRNPAISPNGEFVAFDSRATNLVVVSDPGGLDTNTKIDVFVRHLTGSLETRRVSLDTASGNADGDSKIPAISDVSSTGDVYVAFQSFATDLITGDTNAVPDVFVVNAKSFFTGTPTVTLAQRVSVTSAGNQVGEGLVVGSTVEVHEGVSISHDGRYVGFGSQAPDVVADDTNRTGDVFVRDRTLGATVRVSVRTLGTQPSGISDFSALSGDGRFVAFISLSSDVVEHDENGAIDVFVRGPLK